jgi:hypothetical protein
MHKYIPSKVSLLAWRILQNKVATEDNLSKRGVLSQNIVFCWYALFDGIVEE